jgi:DNA-binding NarL/FixJ family response regulator
VLELLQTGRSNGEIAAQLHIGVETVRTHARSIYRKLGVRSRRELART